MRKNLILFFAIVALLLVACSNGDSASVDVDEMSCAAASPGSSSSEFWVVSSSETALEVSSSSTESSSSELYISYGMMVDERDGQEYKTVAIGNLVWMAENLNYAYLQPTSTLDSSSWYYDYEYQYYGRLYLWSAAIDSAAIFSNGGKGCGMFSSNENWVKCPKDSIEQVRGVCPKGWRLPVVKDFEKLLVVREGIAMEFYDTDLTNPYNGEGHVSPSGTTAFWLAVEKDFAHALVDGYHVGSNEDHYLDVDKKERVHSVRCVKDYDFALFE